MNIGIDCRAFENPVTGIGKYLYFLLSNLIKLDSKNKYFLFFKNSKFDLSEIITYNHVKCIKIKGKDIFIESLLFPFFILRYKLKVFFSPANYGVPYFIFNSKLILTVHDLNPIKMGDEYWQDHCIQLKKKYLFKQKKSLKKANEIICVSNSTKNDIVKYFTDIDARNINVIYEASCLSGIKKDKNALIKYKIDNFFCIQITSYSKYKNTQLVIDAFNIVKKQNIDLQLVVVGKTYERYKKEQGIIFTETVTDNELSFLLKQAVALIFVSKFEGFGLPILEAFSFGTKVLAFNTEVNNEIFGDNLFYIEDENSIALSEAILKVFKLYKKKQCDDKLELFSKTFSWEQTAKLTLKVINN